MDHDIQSWMVFPKKMNDTETLKVHPCKEVPSYTLSQPICIIKVHKQNNSEDKDLTRAITTTTTNSLTMREMLKGYKKCPQY